MKKIYGLISGIILCIIIFLIENKELFLGRFINRLKACLQVPGNSFPCYGVYDIGLMTLVIIVGLILFGIIIFRVIKGLKNK